MMAEEEAGLPLRPAEREAGGGGGRCCGWLLSLWLEWVVEVAGE